MDVTATVERYTQADKKSVFLLLDAAELPFQDLTDEKLKHFWVARDSRGTVAAVVGVEPFAPYGLLRSLAVAPGRRGYGLGSKLLKQVENHARKQGIKTLYLLTDTVVGFFSERGYDTVARESVPDVIRTTSEFTETCPQDASCFSKTL